MRGVLLHHDNASAHTAAQTLEFVADWGVQLMTHPAYSPDLAPCDFFLFPKCKEILKGQIFSSPEEAVNEFKDVIGELRDEDWRQCFDSWFHRMQACINAGGEYFEQL